MVKMNYTGNLDDLISMVSLCRIRGQWYYSIKHDTYELSSAQSRVTWTVPLNDLEVYSRDQNAAEDFCRTLAMFEDYKAAGTCLALPKSRRPRILPMRTVHTLGGAYNLHHAHQAWRKRRGRGTPSVKVPTDAVMPSAHEARGALGMIRLVAKPSTPAQTKLCETFSRRLEQALQADVDPDAFEDWIGTDALNAWTRAATKLGMASETKSQLHSHNYLSDQDEHLSTASVVRLFPG
jgi:hypothetical protein